MGNVLAAVRGRLRSRNGALLIDTSITAITGVLLVIMGARSLVGAQFDHFATTQLVAVALVGIVRSTFYAPAMQSQRTTGRAVLGYSWLLRTSLPVAVVGGIVFGIVLSPTPAERVSWATALVIALVAVLLQDGARSILLSRDLVRGALIADIAALTVLLTELFFGRSDGNGVGLLITWAAAATAGLAVSLAYLIAKQAESADLPRQTLAAAWRLGKWAGLDAVLAQTASLLPFFVATLVIAGGDAGIYRTLLSALGPLNIIHTTVITSFSLDSWRAATPEGLAALRRKVGRLTLGMIAFSTLYVLLGIPAMVLVAELSSDDLLRIAIIVAIGAILGAANTAPNAGALVLGYQWAGAVIRGVVVAASVVISLPWVTTRWVPWQDAIGATWLVASAAALIGWGLAYLSGMRKESASLPRRASV